MVHPALSLSIDDLDLPVRASNCLTAAGIEDVRDLVRRTRTDLLNIRNLGATSLTDIERALANHRLRLGIGDEELALVLAFNEPVAVQELESFLSAVNATSCDQLASLVCCDAEELLSEHRLDAESLAALQGGLQRWGITLGLPVAEEGLERRVENTEGARIAPRFKATTFREELRLAVSYPLNRQPSSWHDCFIAYYGLDGQDATLDAIGLNGEEYGFGRPVTRERVRQVLVKARKAIQADAPLVRFHCWDPVVKQLRAESPIEPEALFSLLGYERPPHVGRAYRRLKEIAEIFGLGPPFELRAVASDEEFIFYASQSISNSWVERLRSAPPTPFAIVAEVAKDVGCEEECLRRVLSVSRRWEFLDTTSQHFWRRPDLPPRDFSKTRNSILTSLCKVFSVGGYASSRDLAMSIGRDRIVRKGGPPVQLPRAVVEGIAEKSGLFDVAAGEIRRKADVEPWNCLSKRDMVLLRVAAMHGRVVSSKDLYSSLVREGLSQGNAGQVVQFSPFLVHTQSGVGETEGIYKFVLDSESTPGDERLQPVAPASSQSGHAEERVEFSEGYLRLEISARTLQFGTFFGPEAAVLVDGVWNATFDGVELGEVAVSGQQITGLNVVTRALCLEKGDRLELFPVEDTRVLGCRRLKRA